MYNFRLVALLMTLSVAPLGADRQFPRIEIGTLVRKAEKMDGRRAELAGVLVLGFETSFLRPANGCGSVTPNCSIWVRFGDCVISKGKYATEPCTRAVAELAQMHQHSDRSEKATLKVVLRGVLHTVRKDVTYDSSVPRSVRVGFGHLGAYPAEIVASEMEVDAP